MYFNIFFIYYQICNITWSRGLPFMKMMLLKNFKLVIFNCTIHFKVQYVLFC